VETTAGLMRVIYVHQYFKTPEEGGAIRSYHLAKGLVDAGIEVEMITAHNKNYYDFRKVDGVKVHYLPVAYQHSFGTFKRIASFLRFVSQAKKLIRKLPRPDLFYLTSTPLTVGRIGLWAKKTLAVPYIFEVRDLWPEAPIQVGVIRNKWLKKALYQWEEKIYHQALQIVALSPGIRNYIVKKKPMAKTVLIPNFSDIGFFSPTKKDPRTLNRWGLKEKFTLAYTGALGAVNALQNFLFLAKEAQHQGKDWQFVMMGQGAKEKELKQLARDLQLANVRFFPFGSKERVRELLSVTDMAYISFDHLPVLRTNSPNKFFDALAAGKAIVTNHKGWVTNLIKEHQLGCCHHPEDHKKAIQKIAAFADDPTLLQSAQKGARALAENHFSKERAVQILLNTIDPDRFKIDPIDGVYTLTA
jgi:glycosyltransferase involved in cell wall biosynthesis